MKTCVSTSAVWRELPTLCQMIFPGRAEQQNYRSGLPERKQQSHFIKLKTTGLSISCPTSTQGKLHDKECLTLNSSNDVECFLSSSLLSSEIKSSEAVNKISRGYMNPNYNHKTVKLFC